MWSPPFISCVLLEHFQANITSNREILYIMTKLSGKVRTLNMTYYLFFLALQNSTCPKSIRSATFWHTSNVDQVKFPRAKKYRIVLH